MGKVARIQEEVVTYWDAGKKRSRRFSDLD